MLIPFLWMVSTSLKTREQVFRSNWVPMKNIVKYNNKNIEVKKIMPATEKPGIYKVEVLSGPEKGRIIDSANTNKLTRISGKIFSYEARGDNGEIQIFNVKLVEKIAPMFYHVEIINPYNYSETIQMELPEDEIIRKISPELRNFPHAVEVTGNFGRSYINSIVVAVITTVGHVFTCSLAAYAFARLKFPGRDVLFLGYLATLMIPGAVTMIPVFVILKTMPDVLNNLFGTDFFSSAIYVQFGSTAARFYAGKPIGLDSYFAIIAPGLFGAYGTFLLRQFFLGLPTDLEDAAKIDGCNLFRVYSTIILPLSKPALATLAIFTFMSSWRGFMWPMVVTSNPNMQTLPVMLQAFASITSTQWELLMAGTLMVIAPLIVVFLIGQRFFIEGIQLGAVKG
jgi:multiple sugar transport system permease protein